VRFGVREREQFYICAVGHDLGIFRIKRGKFVKKDVGGRGEGLTMSELAVRPSAWVPPSITLGLVS
jgi:hypothetical protein